MVVRSTGCQTGLTSGWMFVYTIQPVVKPVVSCERGISGGWFDGVLVLVCDAVVTYQQAHSRGSSVLMNLLIDGRDVDFGYRLQPGLEEDVSCCL